MASLINFEDVFISRYWSTVFIRSIFRSPRRSFWKFIHVDDFSCLASISFVAYLDKDFTWLEVVALIWLNQLEKV